MAKMAFALNNWTAELRHDGWYYGDTYGQAATEYRGPYTSMASVTLMIAREMTKDIARRQQRMVGVS